MFLTGKQKKELARLDTALLEIGYELLRRAEREEMKREIQEIMALLQSNEAVK